MQKKQGNSQTISWFYDLYKRNLLDLDPPYQRRSVWNQKYKDYFIDTILLDYPCPPIFLYEEINQNGIAKYSVVDGKQRLTTIFEFIDGAYPVFNESTISDLVGFTFKDFTNDNRIKFFSYNISVEYLPTNNETLIKDIFQRLNKNIAKLTPQELRHARYDGIFINDCEELTEWMTNTLGQDIPKFARNSINKMIDVEFTAQLLLLIDEGVKGYLPDDLDEAFNNRDLLWEKREQVINIFKDNITKIREILNISSDIKNSRIKNQADFYGVFGALISLDASLFNAVSISQKLVDFFNIVDNEENRIKNENANKYYITIRTNTNKTAVRSDRIDILKVIIK